VRKGKERVLLDGDGGNTAQGNALGSGLLQSWLHVTAGAHLPLEVLGGHARQIECLHAGLQPCQQQDAERKPPPHCCV